MTKFVPVAAGIVMAMQTAALQALPIGPLSSRINLSVHSSLPALLTVLALVLTPQEPAKTESLSVLKADLSFSTAHDAVQPYKKWRLHLCMFC